MSGINVRVCLISTHSRPTNMQIPAVTVIDISSYPIKIPTYTSTQVTNDITSIRTENVKMSLTFRGHDTHFIFKSPNMLLKEEGRSRHLRLALGTPITRFRKNKQTLSSPELPKKR